MERIGKYEPQEETERGSYWTSYRATDTTLGRLVTLKVIHAQLTGEPGFLEKLRKEAGNLAGLKSRDSVGIYEIGESDGRVIIAMEYMEGGTLRELLKKEGKLTFEESLAIMYQVCAGLEGAHQKGLAHCDIQPDNIVFDREGNALISDFGLARAVQNASRAAKESMGLSGTAAYRAPELWEGDAPPCPETDIYALGCILSEMLSGEVLFDGESPAKAMTQHLLRGARIPDSIPAGVREALEKALTKEARDRFRNTKELLAELESRGEAEKGTITAAGPARQETTKAKEEEKKAGKKAPSARIRGRHIVYVFVGVLAVIGLIALCFIGLMYIVFEAAKIDAEDTKTAQAAQNSISMIVSDKDGMAMVYVPAGEFEMGTEQSQHRVYLDGYYIDQTEVTNAQYAEFLNEMGNQIEEGRKWYNDGQFPEISQADGIWQVEKRREDHPVVLVSWYGANAYCEWAGKQLPTEAQWEKAARGTDGRTYPWGEGLDCYRAKNIGHCDVNYLGTKSVGHYGDLGASPYGAFDMTGNVDEWVADWYNSDYYRISPKDNPSGPSSGDSRVVRGKGSTYDRDRSHPRWESPYTGFRCTRIP